MAQLNFNVMDDLIESRRTFDNFIAAPNTREVIEEAITIMAESIKNGGQVISAGNGGSRSAIRATSPAWAMTTALTSSSRVS